MQAAIDNVRAPGGGRIGLTACPGIAAAVAGGNRRGAALDADLAAIAGWRARALVTLIEPHELTLLGVEGLGERAMAQGLAWWHLPIIDGAAPGGAFEPRWAESGPALHRHLDADERIVIHCHAGMGRSGTVAARLLVERGMAPEQAIRTIRRARPGAIENDEQVRWVLACDTR
jgi:ADP-ribosyl-[dinitrogen reductase] hydrolase